MHSSTKIYLEIYTYLSWASCVPNVLLGINRHSSIAICCGFVLRLVYNSCKYSLGCKHSTQADLR